jgi:hypothetical protein
MLHESLSVMKTLGWSSPAKANDPIAKIASRTNLCVALSLGKAHIVLPGRPLYKGFGGVFQFWNRRPPGLKPGSFPPQRTAKAVLFHWARTTDPSTTPALSAKGLGSQDQKGIGRISMQT